MNSTIMILSNEELDLVSGGDAAATRQPGQNSWGEYGEDPIGDIIRQLGL
jgi:hypothetical protein